MSVRSAFSGIPAFFKEPIVRAGLTSCVVMGVGDALCQSLLDTRTLQSNQNHPDASHPNDVVRSTDTVSSEQTHSGTEEDKPRWDPWRTARFSLIGLTLHGPYFYTGFRTLDTYFGPSKSIATALKKTFAGQVDALVPIFLILCRQYFPKKRNSKYGIYW